MESCLKNVECNVDKIGEKFDSITKNLCLLEKNNVQEIQKDILKSLYEIRENLFTDLSKIKDFNGNSNNNKENNDKEKEEIIEDNKRKEYRIKHLVKNLKEEIENNEDKKKINDLSEENKRLQYRISHLVKNYMEDLKPKK